MFAKFHKFTALSSNEKLCFIQAYFLLGMMRAAILTIPFKKLVASLEHARNKEEKSDFEVTDINRAKIIGRAVSTAAGQTPWNSNCLAQALTAQYMLKKQNIPGSIYLGVSNGSDFDEPLKGHAWVICGGEYITGKHFNGLYTIVSEFRWIR